MPRMILLVLVPFMCLVGSCGSDDNNEMSEPEIGPVTVSFTASTPIVINEGTSAEVTFSNTSTGNSPRYFWAFGEQAIPLAVEVVNRADQTIVYPLIEEEQTVEVVLEARDNNGNVLGTATNTITIPASEVMEEEEEEEELNCSDIIFPNPIRFENGEEFFTFGGASFALVPNPSQTGDNPNDTMVGQITNSGAAFEGSGISLDPPTDFSGDDKRVRLLLFSNVEVPIALQFVEGVNGVRGVEAFATHTGSGWEEIILDYTNATTVFLSPDDPGGEPLVPDGQYGQIVLFIDGPGTTAGDFFIDDIGFCDANSGGDDPDGDDPGDDPVEPVFANPITFENGEEFFTFGGVSFAIVPNPSQTGDNPNDTMVGQITNSGVAFEGSGIDLNPAANFTTDNKLVSVLFFSNVEVPLALQFVQGVNGEREVETFATHTGSGWEEVVFDYNNATTVFLSPDDPGGEPLVPSGEYGQIVLFIDGPGTTSGDFFIDDIGVD